jgi:hypothetical protein
MSPLGNRFGRTHAALIVVLRQRRQSIAKGVGELSNSQVNVTSVLSDHAAAGQLVSSVIIGLSPGFRYTRTLIQVLGSGYHWSSKKLLRPRVSWRILSWLRNTWRKVSAILVLQATSERCLPNGVTPSMALLTGFGRQFSLSARHCEYHIPGCLLSMGMSSDSRSFGGHQRVRQ